ncbi:hypothetical protein ACFWY5_35380 [Nonomuraea sp. NPDC059007]|uniref:hypothetical protein n=1 Tax=Nonomuraea sp. NPDC059007 TaxID=3346692 RepID=UPI0036760619
MPVVLRRVLAVVVAAATLAGCGITDTDAHPAGQLVRGSLTASGSRLLRVYFVTPQGTWPVSRPALAGDRLPQAMKELWAGPTADERARGLITHLPPAARPVQARATEGGVEVRLPWLVRDMRAIAVSQVVCTAAAASDAGGDAVIEVLEPGMGDNPWRVRCDENGTADPVGQGGFS